MSGSADANRFSQESLSLAVAREMSENFLARLKAKSVEIGNLELSAQQLSSQVDEVQAALLDPSLGSKDNTSPEVVKVLARVEKLAGDLAGLQSGLHAAEELVALNRGARSGRKAPKAAKGDRGGNREPDPDGDSVDDKKKRIGQDRRAQRALKAAQGEDDVVAGAAASGVSQAVQSDVSTPPALVQRASRAREPRAAGSRPVDTKREKEPPQAGQKIYLAPDRTNGETLWTEVEFVSVDPENSNKFLVIRRSGGGERSIPKGAFSPAAPSKDDTTSEFEGSEYYKDPLEKLGFVKDQEVLVPPFRDATKRRTMKVLRAEGGLIVVWTGRVQAGRKEELRFTPAELKTKKSDGEEIIPFKEIELPRFATGQRLYQALPALNGAPVRYRELIFHHVLAAEPDKAWFSVTTETKKFPLDWRSVVPEPPNAPIFSKIEGSPYCKEWKEGQLVYVYSTLDSGPGKYRGGKIISVEEFSAFVSFGKKSLRRGVPELTTTKIPLEFLDDTKPEDGVPVVEFREEPFAKGQRIYIKPGKSDGAYEEVEFYAMSERGSDKVHYLLGNEAGDTKVGPQTLDFDCFTDTLPDNPKVITKFTDSPYFRADSRDVAAPTLDGDARPQFLEFLTTGDVVNYNGVECTVVFLKMEGTNIKEISLQGEFYLESLQEDDFIKYNNKEYTVLSVNREDADIKFVILKGKSTFRVSDAKKIAKIKILRRIISDSSEIAQLTISETTRQSILARLDNTSQVFERLGQPCEIAAKEFTIGQRVTAVDATGKIQGRLVRFNNDPAAEKPLSIRLAGTDTVLELEKSVLNTLEAVVIDPDVFPVYEQYIQIFKLGNKDGFAAIFPPTNEKQKSAFQLLREDAEFQGTLNDLKRFISEVYVLQAASGVDNNTLYDDAGVGDLIEGVRLSEADFRKRRIDIHAEELKGKLNGKISRVWFRPQNDEELEAFRQVRDELSAAGQLDRLKAAVKAEFEMRPFAEDVGYWTSIGCKDWILPPTTTIDTKTPFDQKFEFSGQPVAVGDTFSLDFKDGTPPLQFTVEDIFDSTRNSQKRSTRTSKFIALRSAETGALRYVDSFTWGQWASEIDTLTKIDRVDSAPATPAAAPEKFEFEGTRVRRGDKFLFEGTTKFSISSVSYDRDEPENSIILLDSGDGSLPSMVNLKMWKEWAADKKVSREVMRQEFLFEGEEIKKDDTFLIDFKDGEEKLQFTVEEFVDGDRRPNKRFVALRSDETGDIRYIDTNTWDNWTQQYKLTKIESLPDTSVQEIDFGGAKFLPDHAMYLRLPGAVIQLVVIESLDASGQHLNIRDMLGNPLSPLTVDQAQYLSFNKPAAPSTPPPLDIPRPVEPQQTQQQPAPRVPEAPRERRDPLSADSIRDTLGKERLQKYYTEFGTNSASHTGASQAIEAFLSALPRINPAERQRMADAIHLALGTMVAGAQKRYLHMHEHYDETETPVEEAAKMLETFPQRMWGKMMDIGKSLKRQAKNILISGGAAAGVGAATGTGIALSVATVSGIGATGAMVAAFAPVAIAGAAAMAGKGAWNYLKRSDWVQNKDKRTSVTDDRKEQISRETWEAFERDEASLAADRVALTIEAVVRGATDPQAIQAYVYDRLVAKTEALQYTSPEAKDDWRSLQLEKKSWERDQLIAPELSYTALAQEFTNRSDFFTHNWEVLGKGYESVAGGDFSVLHEDKQKALAGGFLSSIVAGTSAMAIVASGAAYGSKLLARAASGFGLGTLRGMATHKSENIISESKKIRSADVALKRGGDTDYIDNQIGNIQLNNKNRAADSLTKGVYGAAFGASLGAAADKTRDIAMNLASSFQSRESSVIVDSRIQPSVLADTERTASEPVPAVRFAHGETVTIGGHEFQIAGKNELIELPKGLAVNKSTGDTLLATTAIGQGHGAEWGALHRLADQYGDFGMTKAEVSNWIKDELTRHGFVFQNGDVGRPWDVHPGLKVEMSVDKDGHPHIGFIGKPTVPGEKGGDYTPHKFVKFQRAVSSTHTVETKTTPLSTVQRLENNADQIRSLKGEDVSLRDVYKDLNAAKNARVGMVAVEKLPDTHTSIQKGDIGETFLGREGNKSYLYVKRPDGTILRTEMDNIFKNMPDAPKSVKPPSVAETLAMRRDFAATQSRALRAQEEYIRDKGGKPLEQSSTVKKQVTLVNPYEKEWVSSDMPVRSLATVERESPFVLVEQALPVVERSGEIHNVTQMAEALEKVNPAGPGAEDQWGRLTIVAYKEIVTDPNKAVRVDSLQNPEHRILLSAVSKDTPFVVSDPPSHGIKIFQDGQEYFLRDDEFLFGKDASNRPIMTLQGADGKEHIYPVKRFIPDLNGTVKYQIEVDGATKTIFPRKNAAS